MGSRVASVVALSLSAVAAACSGSRGATSLASVVAEPAGAHCPNGGQAIQTGIDDDGDGSLDPSEVTSTAYVCNGAGGTGTVFSAEILPAGDSHCAAGGVALSRGLDNDGDGTLDASEVSGTNYVCNGANGANGADGALSLVTLATETAGANCPFGGKAIRSGLDKNGDALLQPAEVTATEYVCNGAPGDAGAGGVTSLVRQDDETPGTNCVHGGKAISSGLDTDDDGELDDGEVVDTTYVCNGAPGAEGPSGAQSLISLVAEPAGVNCPAGGQKVVSGVDLDGSGTLTGREVKATVYLCSGANRLYTTATAFPGGVCPRGGVRVESGIDADGDGVLDRAEIDAGKTQYVCNLHPVAISAGGNHTCVLLSDATVRCWGSNSHGQLGNGDNVERLTPVPVQNLTGVSAISAGYSHTCALLSDATVRCWGYNYYGQLGNNSTTDSRTPVAVSGLAGASAVVAGSNHTCALLSSGAARCWGYNAHGQLGNNSTTDSRTPVAVSGLAGAAAIVVGFNDTCALLSDGTARCWGANGYGQLGDGSTTSSSIPVTVSDLSGVTTIDADDYHACARLSDGTARCWGRNSDGQLGNRTTTSSSIPVTVFTLSGVTSLAAGGRHSCALLSDGAARCWGLNAVGQLGNDSTTSSLAPVRTLLPF